MKILLLFASVIMLAACSTDNEQTVKEVKSFPKNSFKVSEEEAIERLEKMLNIFTPATRGKKRTIKEIIPHIKPQTRSYTAEIPDTMYYYVNFDNNDGYAIVAADERAIPILALIDTGNYVPPQAYINWTETLVDSLNSIYTLEEDDFWCFRHTATIKTIEFIDDLCEGYIADTHYYSEYSTQDTICMVKPLLQTKWNQQYPYNARCWNLLYLLTEEPNALADFTGYHLSESNAFDLCSSSKYTYPAGCVAIALAQICAYHQHPNVSPEDGHQYNWNSISSATKLPRTNYDPINDIFYLNPKWSLDQKEQVCEVSHLIKDTGLAAKTVYGEKASSSNIKLAKHAMENVMGYSVTRKNYFNSDNIRNELDNKRPVFQSGKSRKPSGGHAWVIDGYYVINIKEYQVEYKDSTYNEELETKLINESMKYYFHCNFGWQGELANGYYLDGLFDTSNGPVALSDQEQEYTSNQYNFKKKLGSLYLAPNK